MTSYSKDPRWLDARFPGRCSSCGEQFQAGERIFYYPLVKKTYSGQCAEANSRDFESARYDEEMA